MNSPTEIPTHAAWPRCGAGLVAPINERIGWLLGDRCRRESEENRILARLCEITWARELIHSNGSRPTSAVCHAIRQDFAGRRRLAALVK